MTATAISPVCRRCGTIEKSGKSSCCGRGGSWFRNCGSAKLDHTWYEGIQVCKAWAQPKRAGGGQSNAAQRLSPSNGVDTGNSKGVMATAKAFAFMSDNTSISTPCRTPNIEPRNASTNKSRRTPDGTPAEATIATYWISKGMR